MSKSYTTNKALLTTKQVQLVNPEKFVTADLDADSKTFVVYMAIWKREKMLVHSGKKAQIGALLFDKAFTEISAEYSNHSNVFLAQNGAELPENTVVNEHAIKLEKGKQLPFGLIYSLDPVELETLKIYIETNLANNFIRLSKSPARAPILFDRKPDGSFYLCINFGVSTISQFRTDIRYSSLENLSIGSAR